MSDRIHLKIPAFSFQGQDEIYKALTGDLLPADYEGLISTFMQSGETVIFDTSIENGERNWKALTMYATYEYV